VHVATSELGLEGQSTCLAWGIDYVDEWLRNPEHVKYASKSPRGFVDPENKKIV